MPEIKERDPLLDAVKGVLILFIVLEHNKLLTDIYDWIRPFCDAFAAGCFLIFTFAWPIKKLTLIQYLDKHFAYYWPYIIFIVATSTINYFLFSSFPLGVALSNFLNALILPSPEVIKISTGFMYLWFLPALCFIYLIRYFSYNYQKISFLIAAITWLGIGTIEDDILTKFPFSLHVIGFIFFLGMLYQRLHQRLISNNICIKAFCIISFTVCSISSYFIGWELFLAGGVIPSWKEPLLLAYYSFFMLIAIPSIYHILSFIPSFFNTFFVFLGKNSLLTYLIHPLIFIAFTQVIPVIKHPFISFVLTIFLCFLTAFLLEKLHFIKSLIFPKKISDLSKSRIG